MSKIPVLPDSLGLTLHDEPLSDPGRSGSGWEAISDPGSSAKSSLAGREYIPEVDNTRDYTDEERLYLALKSYYLKLDAYEIGRVSDPLFPLPFPAFSLGETRVSNELTHFV